MCVFQCFWALGACFEVLLALIIMPSLGWQWLLALSTIPLLAFALITPVSADKSLMIYMNTTLQI